MSEQALSLLDADLSALLGAPLEAPAETLGAGDIVAATVTAANSAGLTLSLDSGLAATCAASDDNCGNGDVCSNVAEYAGNHHAAAAAYDDNCGNGGNLGDSAVLRGTLACFGSCEHRVRVIHDVRRGDLLFYFNEFSI